MKNIKKIIGLVSMFIFTIVFACACGQKSLESIAIKEGTLKRAYMLNDEYSFDNLIVIATYSDGTKEEVGKKDLTISEFSTAQVGKPKITITYKDKSLEVEMLVTNDQDEYYHIYGVESPESILTYKNNKADKDVDEKENEFYIRSGEESVYVVGDDNPFKFFPNITALDDENHLLTINSYRSISKVYYKTVYAGEYEELTGDDIATYVAIDEYHSTYDFTDAAIGKFFKLEVKPYYLSDEQKLEEENYTQELEFKVVDGYNVTNALELGVLNNHSDNPGAENNKQYDNWVTLLSNHGITMPTELNGIVLHDNITITTNDIPQTFLMEENGQIVLNDDLKNSNAGGNTDIYYHITKLENSFNFYGNYFTIDASKLPLISKEARRNGVSHTTLFKFSSTNSAYVNVNDTSTTYTNIKNVSFIGNGKRENSDVGFGSLILTKANNHQVDFTNCIMRAFYINTMVEYANTYVTMNYVKSYDAYQNAVFLWAGHLDIKNSELKRAGGPLMILQHPVKHDTGGKAHVTETIPVVTVDDNTELESLVSGTEAWFASLGLTSTATLIKSLSDKIYEKSSHTASFVVNNNGVQYINLIAVNMTDGTTIDDQNGCQGKFKIGEIDVINLIDGEINPIIPQIINGAIAKEQPQPPIFSSTGGGLGVFNGQDIVNPAALMGMEAPVDTKLFQGDYLGLYYQGLGLSLGYFHNN